MNKLMQYSKPVVEVIDSNDIEVFIALASSCITNTCASHSCGTHPFYQRPILLGIPFDGEKGFGVFL